METTTLLPGGTVTMLFTDIEGSTRLLQRLGERYADLLADHHRLLRAAFQAWSGCEMNTAGDAFFVIFPRAGDALAAALQAQQALASHSWPEGLPVRVRMGLHTGEPLRTETGYLGLDVHRAARLAAAGHGGQILLSQAAYELVRDALPAQTSLRDLGAHRLKDLQRPEQVYQLLHPALPADFPPLKSLDTYAHNLPLQPTRFIGREQALAAVKELLDGTRLLTLTGTGGCGKTRLALQVAADRVDQYPDGVWLVELAALTDPALVVPAVAAALRLREEPGRPLRETLLDDLRPRALLLLLDNCEHLVQASAALAATLLRECPAVKLLATSREALGIAGETLWRVPSLSLPESPARLSAERLSQYEAVRRFLDRARLSRPDFALTEESAAWVAEICQRLDGIPLAIELAAARVKALPPAEIAARLDDRFQLLTGGDRTALPRQQTLQAAMDWSYDLLAEPERLLLRRLSVFAGGFTLAASEAVCAGPGLDERGIYELIEHLVDKSLSVMEPSPSGLETPEPRYRLLETVRQYAAERLQEAGEAPAARRRHRDFFLSLVERAQPELEGPHQAEWLQKLEQEHDNLRSALTWCTERARAEGGRWPGRLAEQWWVRGSLRVTLRALALREGRVDGLWLGGALSPFWRIRGFWVEGRERLTDMLAPVGAVPPRSADPERSAAQIRRRIRRLYGSALTKEPSFIGLAAATVGILVGTGSAVLLTHHRELLSNGTARKLAMCSIWLLSSIWLYLATGRLRSQRARALRSYRALRPGWWRQGSVELTHRVPPRWLQVSGLLICLLPLLVLLLLEVLLAGWILSDRAAMSSGVIVGVILSLLLLWVPLVLLTQLLNEMLAQLLASTGSARIEALAQALHGAAQLADAQGDGAAAWPLYNETLTLYRLRGSIPRITGLLNNLATMALRQGQAPWAQSLYEMSLVIWLRRGDRHGIATALHNLGSVSLQQQNNKAAQSFLAESLEIRRELGDQHGVATSLHCLGRVRLNEQQYDGARSLFNESLAIRQTLGDKAGITECLEGLAGVAAHRGHAEQAARLLGAAAALREELGAPLPPAEQAEQEGQVAAIRDALGEAGFEAAWAEGRGMPPERAVARAL